jgi:hypothetical protein
MFPIIYISLRFLFLIFCDIRTLAHSVIAILQHQVCRSHNLFCTYVLGNNYG